MSKPQKSPVTLSPSKLNLFLECPLCFWLSERGIHRPKGPFPSLPGGMDRKLKVYFDKYRAKGEMPPELKGKVEGLLFDDLEKMDIWRANRKGLRWKDEKGNELMGAIDDCLFNKKTGEHIVVDFKTYGGSEIKDDKIEFYQNQMDCYSLLFEKNGLKHPGFAYLIFFMPKEVKENGHVDFEIVVKKVKVNSKRALKTFESAVKIINGKRPKKHSECEFCAWADDSIKFE